MTSGSDLRDLSIRSGSFTWINIDRLDAPWTFLGAYSTFIIIFLASIIPVLCMFTIFRKLKWL